METIIAWGIPLAGFLVVLAILLRGRGPGDPLPNRAIIAAIVIFAAAGALLDALA